MSGDQYNYAVFPPEDDPEIFGGFPHHITVGERAPDGTLLDLETGQSVRLSELTRNGLTILEFGSLT